MGEGGFGGRLDGSGPAVVPQAAQKSEPGERVGEITSAEVWKGEKGLENKFASGSEMKWRKWGRERAGEETTEAHLAASNNDRI
jgi:hypothetical protein